MASSVYCRFFKCLSSNNIANDCKSNNCNSMLLVFVNLTVHGHRFLVGMPESYSRSNSKYFTYSILAFHSQPCGNKLTESLELKDNTYTHAVAVRFCNKNNSDKQLKQFILYITFTRHSLVVECPQCFYLLDSLLLQGSWHWNIWFR